MLVHGIGSRGAAARVGLLRRGTGWLGGAGIPSQLASVCDSVQFNKGHSMGRSWCAVWCYFCGTKQEENNAPSGPSRAMQGLPPLPAGGPAPQHAAHTRHPGAYTTRLDRALLCQLQCEANLACIQLQWCGAAAAAATPSEPLQIGPICASTPVMLRSPLLHLQARNRLIAVKAAQAAAAIRKKEGELSGSDEETEERSVRGERRALQVRALCGSRNARV